MTRIFGGIIDLSRMYIFVLSFIMVTNNAHFTLTKITDFIKKHKLVDGTYPDHCLSSKFI
jgi:hypothetical protein